MGFQAAELLARFGNVPQELGTLKLRFENVLLIALANAIPGIGNFFDLFNQRFITGKNLEGLLDVRKVIVGHLDLFGDGASDRLQPVPLRGGLTARFFAAQTQLAGIRHRLRNADAEEGHLDGVVIPKRNRCARRHILHHDFGIGQCRYLRRHLCGGLPGMMRGEDFRVVILRFLDQRGEGSGGHRLVILRAAAAAAA